MAIQYPQGYDDDFINTIKKLIDHVNEYGKTIQDLVAEGQLTPEQYAELINTVNAHVKSGFINKADLSDQLRSFIEEKANKDYVDQQFQNVASGSPKGAYTTLSELENAHPNGTEGIYVVTADGNWYYYDGSSWQAGGVYQTTQWQNALTTQNESWEVV